MSMTRPTLVAVAAALLATGAQGYCPNLCSGNGHCDAKFLVCRCFRGFFGFDCSLQQCPEGKAWGVVTGVNEAHALAECSGRGTCAYATGTCSCQLGFTGDACQHTECPDGCSAHGRCVPMQTHAANEVLSRELYDAFQYQYDAVWDADVLYGCECDPGYTGPGCSLKVCPEGDDPLTKGQVDEVQLVQCLTTYQTQTITLWSDAALSGGTFRLDFGKQTTRPISYNAAETNGASVLTALQALQGVAAVTVTQADPSSTRRDWVVAFPTSNSAHNALVPRWKMIEVQQFICAADGGSFALSFGNQTVRGIPYNADTNTLKSRLKDMPFIDTVDVTLSDNLITVCSAGGTYVTVTFTKLWRRDLVGDLPSMTFSKLNDKGDTVTLMLNGSDGFIDSEAKELVKGIDTCRIVEVQSLLCAATGGAFALTFEDNTVVAGIAFDTSAANLRSKILAKVTYIVDVDVTYSGGYTTACSVIGTTITISYVVVKRAGPAGDGDLSEVQADRTNGGTNGLVHISNRLQFPTAFTEVVKGATCTPLSQSYARNPAGQMTVAVNEGGGTFTLAFRGFTSRPIRASSTASAVRHALLKSLPSLQGVTVTFSGAQACETPANLMSLTFTQNFGNLPTMVVNGLMLAAGSSIAVAGGGAQLAGVASVDSTKESESCSNRGICDDAKLGRCACFVGYTSSNGRGEVGTLQTNRGDCGALSRIPIACPGELACSGHGTCSGSPTFRCACAKGWRGGDCSERTCPLGTSWFDYPIDVNSAHRSRVECSGAGTCDRSMGVCRCPRPYMGPACEQTLCGGSFSECSGNGRCLTLSDLAPLVTVRGTIAGFTYGEDPNDPRTWDANKIRSCLCDPGFFGFDCSLRECPRGDDFNTDKDSVERQVVQCTATDGSFTLSFRDEWTASIPFNAQPSVVKAALDALDGIQEVTVTFVGGTTACSSSNTVMLIDFLRELGDLPSLAGSTSALRDSATGNGLDGSGTLQFATGGAKLAGQDSIAGTRENALCSNHGYCDFSTGVCTCDANYGGSNGLGGPGAIANCGYHQLKYIASADATAA